MAQFDVYTNTNTKSKKLFPYFLDIQHDVLDSIDTRVIIPLSNIKLNNKVLNPLVQIDKEEYILMTTELTSILKSKLNNKVCSLKHKRDEIISSIDFLITGF